MPRRGPRRGRRERHGRREPLSRLEPLLLAFVAACARPPGRAADGALPPLPPPTVALPSADASTPQPEPGPEIELADAPLPPSPGDPFAAPPSAPHAPVPPPPRPPGTEPSAEKRARDAAYCAKYTDCGVCTNAGGCGYCAAEGRCVPKDAHGPYPGTCSADFNADRCSASIYFARDEATIHARMRDLLRGMEPAGPPIDTKIDGSSPRGATLRIPVARGFCYGLAARQSYDLMWVNVEAAANAAYVEDGGDWVAVYQQSGVLTPFCPQTSGTIVVRIAPDTGAPVPVLGTYRVQLFRSPIADAELRARVAKVEAQQRRERVRYVCAHCTKVFLACRLDGQPRCADAYASCLVSGGVTADACERGDVAPPKPKPPWDT